MTFNIHMEARQEFERTWARGIQQRLLRLGRRSFLCSFVQEYHASDRKGMVDAGVIYIPLDKILGSVSKNKNFDAAFNPTSLRTEQRWTSIYKAYVDGIGLPPIDVYQLDGKYYVEDGHHRVSVAKTLGYLSIEANVRQVGVQESSYTPKAS